MHPSHQIQTIFLKATQNNLTLNYIEEVKELCKTFEGREDFEEIEMECKGVIGTIYSLKKHFEEAFILDLERIALMPVSHNRYWGLMYSSTRNSTELGKTDEIRPYAVSFLKHGLFNFGGHLSILTWYVSHYPTGENGSLSEFELLLSAIAAELYLNLKPSLPFATRVDLLKKEDHRACRKSNDLEMSMLGAIDEQRKQLLDDYMESEPPNWYRNYMINKFPLS